MINIVHVSRLKQRSTTNDERSTNFLADDVSSCDDNESESEEQDDEKLPMVIVRRM
jgi:hypothetical protein